MFSSTRNLRSSSGHSKAAHQEAVELYTSSQYPDSEDDHEDSLGSVNSTDGLLNVDDSLTQPRYQHHSSVSRTNQPPRPPHPPAAAPSDLQEHDDRQVRTDIFPNCGSCTKTSVRQNQNMYFAFICALYSETVGHNSNLDLAKCGVEQTSTEGSSSGGVMSKHCNVTDKIKELKQVAESGVTPANAESMYVSLQHDEFFKTFMGQKIFPQLVPKKAKEVRWTKILGLTVFALLTTVFVVLVIPGVHDKYGMSAPVRWQTRGRIQWSTYWDAGRYTLTLVPGINFLAWFLRCSVSPGMYNVHLLTGVLSDTLMSLGLTDAFLYLGMTNIAGISDFFALIFGALSLFTAQCVLFGYIRNPSKYIWAGLVSLLGMAAPYALLLSSYAYSDTSTVNTVFLSVVVGLSVLRQCFVLIFPMFHTEDKYVLHMRFEWVVWAFQLVISCVFCFLGYVYAFDFPSDLYFM
jgi:hypothetical protein